MSVCVYGMATDNNSPLSQKIHSQKNVKWIINKHIENQLLKTSGEILEPETSVLLLADSLYHSGQG